MIFLLSSFLCDLASLRDPFLYPSPSRKDVIVELNVNSQGCFLSCVGRLIPWTRNFNTLPLENGLKRQTNFQQIIMFALIHLVHPVDPV
jgi:hypothetical protein